jgi:6-phosphogluconate dehydrogenase
MTNKPLQRAQAIGMIGLGVRGRDFLMNMADHGVSMAGYDKDPAKVLSLRQEAKGRDFLGAESISEFIALLRRPRVVILLVPAGPSVDSVINELLPYLQPDDLIVDAANSYFKDTDARARNLSAKGIQFLGVGMSNEVDDSAIGPCIMVGGPKEAYERVRLAFEATAAYVNGQPCVAYLGPESAGHFVKMVHDGIEYGLMQLIGGTYDLMKRGLGLNDDELHDFFAGWNQGEMRGYLMRITGDIFSKKDPINNLRLVDEIKGVAKHLGTGTWTSLIALELEVPIPTIDAAVAMRNLSVLESERAAASAALHRSAVPFRDDQDVFLQQLGHALFVGIVITYAQGLALLKRASERYSYALDLSVVARIWRGGCIIRTDVLDHIQRAYHNQPALPNLLLDPELTKMLVAYQEDLRIAVIAATKMGLPAPAMMTALSYFDAYRSSWLPTNLIQAQRDYFGAYRYERTDTVGSFHTEWEKRPD